MDSDQDKFGSIKSNRSSKLVQRLGRTTRSADDSPITSPRGRSNSGSTASLEVRRGRPTVMSLFDEGVNYISDNVSPPRRGGGGGVIDKTLQRLSNRKTNSQNTEHSDDPSPLTPSSSRYSTCTTEELEQWMATGGNKDTTSTIANAVSTHCNDNGDDYSSNTKEKKDKVGKKMMKLENSGTYKEIMTIRASLTLFENNVEQLVAFKEENDEFLTMLDTLVTRVNALECTVLHNDSTMNHRIVLNEQEEEENTSCIDQPISNLKSPRPTSLSLQKTPITVASKDGRMTLHKSNTVNPVGQAKTRKKQHRHHNKESAYCNPCIIQ